MQELSLENAVNNVNAIINATIAKGGVIGNMQDAKALIVSWETIITALQPKSAETASVPAA